MLKLIKYEYIKNRIILLLSLGFITLAELMLIVGSLVQNITLAVSSLIMFGIFGLVMFFVPLVIGILTYTKELSGKEGFLIYMTPNSTYKIVGAKFIFTLSLLAAYSAVFAAYVGIDVLIGRHNGLDLKVVWENIGNLFAVFGLSFTELVLAIIILVVGTLLSLLMYAALYYLIYTLTTTFLQNTKGRNAISTLLFIAAVVLLTKVKGIIPAFKPLADNGHMVLAEVIPASILALVIVIISWFSCSYMLDRKISL